MFENVGRSVALLGGAVGLTLCLASGVAVGVVPQASGPSNATGRPAAAVAGQDVTATTTPGTAAPTTVAPAAPGTVAPTTAAPTTKPRAQAATPTASSSSAAEQSSTSATPAAQSAAPAGPTKAARVSPSSSQVQAAIAQIHQRIPLYSPTEAQARQFGDQVCSAFDQGQSSAQVQATALQAASKVPFVTVSAGDVAFAVRTAVSLFCPGYSSKV
ncbi:MAG: DUF732 domain-containing protein [Acidimicrobiales bacterium]